MTSLDLNAALSALAAQIAERRADILARWRQSVNDDVQIAGSNSMTRAQFYDHIPRLLDAFSQKLLQAPRAEDAAQEAKETELAQQHSHHRWQQGYSVRSLVREWGHLNGCLVALLNELDAPEVALASARLSWAEFVNHNISEGVSEYEAQLQIEARGRLSDLEETVETVRGLEAARAELLRQVSHDLRGGLSMVAGASSLLGNDAIGGSDREHVISIMQGGVRSVAQMLSHLMDVSRLEAGQESRHIDHFDAAQVLQELSNNSQMLADEKGLWLITEGPESIPTQGDISKVQRVAQNLLLNAVKYTVTGGITVTWSEAPNNQWVFSIEDTGPGLSRSNAAPLAAQIQQATAEAQQVGAATPTTEEKAENPVEPAPPTEPHTEPPTVPPANAPQPLSPALTALPGEGIGLSIVRRLCEIIEATIEMESEAGKGSKITVTLPRSYQGVAENAS